MKITSFGAAQEVTGSRHLLDTGTARILIDCGLFQGRREESRAKNEQLGFDPADITACVNTHGHLDHCGAYPMLARAGWRGTIWATGATVDIAALVMADSARIQVSDARFLAKQIRRNPRADGRKVFEPLYGPEDAEAATGLFRGVRYHEPFAPAKGVSATLLDAGHILGSSVVRLEVDTEGGGKQIVVFSGDLGRKNTPLLKDPEDPREADWLVCESTYGDRLHDEIAFAEDELAEVIRSTAARGGRVIIPAFAIGRTQEIVYHLHRLAKAGHIPAIPVYVDSPMAVSATDIFRRHPECYDAETVDEFLDNGESPFAFGQLHYITSVEDSKRLNELRMPCVIVSASGMCEAGRILHHLLLAVADHRNTIAIVGFMAQNTLGRALADKRRTVKIFGEEHEVRATVKILNAFSAHADRDEIGRWVSRFDLERLQGVALVHGEPKAQEALAAHLTGLGVKRVERLEQGQPLRL